MSQQRLATVFVLSAAILMPVTFFLVLAYAGPEPFFNYRRIDAIGHIGISNAAIALWFTWSLGILGLVIARVFGARWLLTLLLAALCISYLQQCSAGYLDDLENNMLSPEQQQRIELPKHKS